MTPPEKSHVIVFHGPWTAIRGRSSLESAHSVHGQIALLVPVLKTPISGCRARFLATVAGATTILGH